MITTAQADIYTDFQGLAQLRAQAGDDPQALSKVAEQFEAVFLHTMLKTMRQASLGEGLLDSDQSRFYQQMFDQQIAVDLAKKRQTGIADLLVSQLGGDPKPDSAASPPLVLDHERLRVHSAAVRNVSAADVVAPDSVAQPIIDRFHSPEDFVTQLWPMAKAHAAQLGVDPAVLVAQAALETGWGQAVNAYSNGVSTRNLFNIKADERWPGPRAVVSTLEYENGEPVRQFAAFRAYGSYNESFQDYVDFLQSSPRYAAALNQADDGPAFVEALHRAGYATDPEYADKIKGILGRDSFREVVTQLKISQG